MKQEHERFGLAVLVVCALLTCTAVSLTIPWAFHIDGQLTPLYWSATGNLVTSQETYPLYVLFYPVSENAVHGWAYLCTARNAIVPLELSGYVRNSWWSLDRASMELNLRETQNVRNAFLAPGERNGIDLSGQWQGPQLDLKGGGGPPSRLSSGLRLEHASVILQRGSESDFNSMCAGARLFRIPGNALQTKADHPTLTAQGNWPRQSHP